MKKFFSIYGLLALCMLVVLPALTSCDDDDKYNTEQYKGGVSLNAFGPSPVARGGELRFLGSGLDKITKVSIPGCEDITDIQVISPNEIRVTVPQTAQPGTVTLHHANGTIETKSMLSFLEPISIENMQPNPVKPGQELVINGEYLNLINEVCFAFIEDGDSVNVYADDFLEHDRKHIKVVVPAEALSGCIYVSDAKAMPNMIKSEEELQIVLPATTALDLTDAKPGQTVTITGTDLDLVTTILLPDGSELDFEYADGKITFVLPENVMDGAIVMVTASGVKVACANVGVVVPTELEAVPAEDLRAGDILKVKGINIDQVVNLTFPGVADAVKPATISATELTVAFPEAAQSGELVLNLKSGKTVAVAISTAKPEAQAYDPATVPAAAEFTIKGKNLDLVTAIEFAGGVQIAIDDKKNVLAASATEIKMIAPATAQTGALKLHMANGEVVECPELTIQAPECAYITVQPEGELTAYGMFTATIANEDKLTGVKVKGENVLYIVNQSQLMFTLPGNSGKNTEVTLVSSNGEISYTYDVIPATHQERVLLTETRDLGSWAGEGDGGAFRLYKEQFADVPAGSKLVFYIESYAYTQIQINDAKWVSFTTLKCDAGAESQMSFELSADVLDKMLTTDDGWSTTALVIQGEGCKVNKVTVEWEISLEETFWEGNANLDGWGGMDKLAWNNDVIETIFKQWKPGQILRAYYNSNGPEPKLKFASGSNWVALPGALAAGDAEGWLTGPTGDNQVMELTLSQEDLDDLVNKNGLIIQANNLVLTKLTIE